VVTLKIAGVPVAVALAATLLFRGLSFWLPMVPGLVFSRGATTATPDAVGSTVGSKSMNTAQDIFGSSAPATAAIGSGAAAAATMAAAGGAAAGATAAAGAGASEDGE